MIRKLITAGCITGLLAGGATQAMAHFGMVIPSSNIVSQQKKTVDLSLSFSHPFELIGMDMVKPKSFYVIADGKSTDLLDTLHEKPIMDHGGWETTYTVKRPGVYQFAMEPQPYWEPAEDLSIIHYTKTVIAAFGDDEGWDQPAGLPTEIVPQLRPFGNYAGNSFSGKVLMNGQPVPFAEVEVELYNQDGLYTAPSDYHVTQVVKADASGIFSFTCPKAGWWGFAALNEADYTLKNPQGEDKGVELGAVLWIYLDEYTSK
jgi:cobalt/nickel transport protein